MTTISIFCMVWTAFFASPVSAPHPCSITVYPPLQVTTTSVPQGSNAVYSCATGYLLVGSSTRYCNTSAILEGVDPTCSLACPLLSTLIGPLSVSVSASNGVATYTCAAGYSLSGSSTRTCQADGTWSGTAPTCSIVSCPSLTAATPLSVSAPSLAYSSVATYSCLTGHSMSGSSTRTCQADSTWSGSAPTCDIITCPTLSATIPLTVNVTAVYIGDVAIYSCAAGFEIDGTNTRTCQNDGTWGDAEPTCTPITCPTMTAPINGQVNFPSGFGVGGEAVFGCNPGYILIDNRTATCTVAGTWDIARPSCLYNGSATPAPVRLYIMPCICYTNRTFTNMTQDEIIAYLVQNTMIQKNSTVKNIYKLKSRSDPRESSEYIGLSGMGIIGTITVLILLSDLPKILRHLKAALTGRSLVET